MADALCHTFVPAAPSEIRDFSPQRSLAMLKQFEELHENVQALMLAKLAIEMKAAKAHSIYHLARVQKSDVSDLWRDICRKAAQPFCTIPIGALENPNPDELGYNR